MVRVDGSGDGNSLISVRNLDKTYKRGSETIDVLQGLNLDVDAGRFRGVHGPKRLGQNDNPESAWRTDVPTHGSVRVAGDEITSMSSEKLTTWRARHVGFVFQMFN